MIVLFFSCKKSNNETERLYNIKNQDSIDRSTKRSIRFDSILSISDTITNLNLSGQSLDSIPNLTSLNICRLDLSNNNLVSLNTDYLPSNLKELNLSKNNLKSFKHMSKQHNLEYLNLSFNNLENVFMWNLPKCELNISNNNLTSFSFILTSGFKPILNISENNNFSNKVDFNPKVFDTILRKNIKNNLPLITINRKTEDKGFIID